MESRGQSNYRLFNYEDHVTMSSMEWLSSKLGGGDNTTSISNNSISTTTIAISNLQQNNDSHLNAVLYSSLSSYEQDMIVNVTREYPLDYANVMLGYMMPVVLVLTLITNSLVVMVLAQPHMRTPTNIVLFTMAIVDLFTLLIPSPWYIYIYTLGYQDKFLYPPVACYAHYVMTDVIPVFFHTSSIWLALLLAGQRYIYVCHPTLARTWCTVPRVRKAIIILLVIAFVHQITRFFNFSFVSIKIEFDKGYAMACKIENSDWVAQINVATYYTTYYTFRILFVFIFPCVALITLNCLLFRALRRAQNKRTELLKTRFKLIRGNQCSVRSGAASAKRPSFLADLGGVKKLNLATNLEAASGCLSITRDAVSSASGGIVFANDKDSIPLELAKNQETGTHLNVQQRARGRESASLILTNNTKDQMIEPNDLLKISSSAAINGRNASEFRNLGDEDDEEYLLNAKKQTGSDNEAAERVTYQSNRGRLSTSNQQQRELKGRFSARKNENSNENKQSKTRESNEPILTSIRGSLNGEIGLDEEDPLTCPDCVACERNNELECQRCASLAAHDGATGVTRGSSSGQRLHKAISQCSSSMGGATNTTTNDDDSSCVGTQNASSSAVCGVVHDETLEGIEVVSMREEYDLDEVDVDIDEEQNEVNEPKVFLNQSIGDPTREVSQQQQQSKRPVGGAKKVLTSNLQQRVTNDDRLACGCPLSPTSKVNRSSGSMTRRTGSSMERRRDDCQSSSCYHCRRCSPTLVQRFITSGAWLIKQQPTADNRVCSYKRGTICSISDPCLKCNSSSSLPGKTKRIRKEMGADLERSGDGDESGGGRVTPTSQSDYGINRGNNCAETGSSSSSSSSSSNNNAPRTGTEQYGNNKQSNGDIFTGGNATATTATTTTTLYSTKTNSAGSLLQIQSKQQEQKQQPVNNERCSSRSGSNFGSNQVISGAQELLKASLAGQIGRGSRATLLGASSSTNERPLIVTGNNLATSTLRTMDNNRTTLMLIVVVSVFLLVEVPVAVVTILHVILNTFEAFQDVQFSTINYVKLFTNFFIMISYSVNFTIYCSMSKKFRETFKDLFKESRRAQKHQSHLSRHQSQNKSASRSRHHLHPNQQQQALTLSTQITNSAAQNDLNVDPPRSFSCSYNNNNIYGAKGCNHSRGIMRYSAGPTGSPQECEL